MQAVITSLVLLSCSGMGLMMWMMMRTETGNVRPSGPHPPPMSPAEQAQLVQLRTELEQLRAERWKGVRPSWR